MSAKPSVGALATVASSASSVTILAANAGRRGATIYNESTAILYLGFTSSAVSTSSYTVQIPPNVGTNTVAYYEVPFGYTGQINGIWASANGNARVTEIA